MKSEKTLNDNYPHICFSLTSDHRGADCHLAWRGRCGGDLFRQQHSPSGGRAEDVSGAEQLFLPGHSPVPAGRISYGGGTAFRASCCHGKPPCRAASRGAGECRHHLLCLLRRDFRFRACDDRRGRHRAYTLDEKGRLQRRGCGRGGRGIGGAGSDHSAQHYDGGLWRHLRRLYRRAFHQWHHPGDSADAGHRGIELLARPQTRRGRRPCRQEGRAVWPAEKPDRALHARHHHRRHLFRRIHPHRIRRHRLCLRPVCRYVHLPDADLARNPARIVEYRRHDRRHHVPDGVRECIRVCHHHRTGPATLRHLGAGRDRQPDGRHADAAGVADLCGNVPR